MTTPAFAIILYRLAPRAAVLCKRASHVSAHDLSLWMSLYAATSLCCAIAVVLSVSYLGVCIAREKPWQTTSGWKAWLLLCPILWWRWQKTYLLTTPVTLGIVTLFSFSLPWGQ